MNMFNNEICEFIILEVLQGEKTKVKDSVNIFYKDIQRIMYNSKMDYNNLSKTFGYKCQLIRDPANNYYFMEVFVTSEIPLA